MFTASKRITRMILSILCYGLAMRSDLVVITMMMAVIVIMEMMRIVNVNVNVNVNTNAKSDPPSVAKVWVYMPRQGTPANHKFPIYQSYVDIIVRGCMSISEDFTKKFLASTHGWWHEDENHHEGPPSYIWLDDRHAPYYVRADKEWSIEMKHIVDEYLKHSQEEPLQKRINLDNIESIRRGMNSL
eukprot:846993_1